MITSALPADIASTVRRALNEDLGTGDLTARLLPGGATSEATVLCRESAVLCGVPWFSEVFRQLDRNISINWRCADGDAVKPGQTVCTLSGSTRSLLSGERTALNFLQLLSGTATTTRGVRNCYYTYGNPVTGYAQNPARSALGSKIRGIVRRRDKPPDGAV